MTVCAYTDDLVIGFGSDTAKIKLFTDASEAAIGGVVQGVDAADHSRPVVAIGFSTVPDGRAAASYQETDEDEDENDESDCDSNRGPCKESAIRKRHDDDDRHDQEAYMIATQNDVQSWITQDRITEDTPTLYAPDLSSAYMRYSALIARLIDYDAETDTYVSAFPAHRVTEFLSCYNVSAGRQFKDVVLHLLDSGASTALSPLKIHFFIELACDETIAGRHLE